MQPNRKTNSNNALIGTFVLLALIGVALYFLFANDTVVNEQPNEVTAMEEPSSQDLIVARGEVATVLTEIQANINAGTNIATTDLNQKLINERRELRAAYQNVTGEAKAEYEALDRDLGRLEAELKGDVKTATVTISGIMSRLESDMRADVRATWEEIKKAANSVQDKIDDDTTIEVSSTSSAAVQ